MTCAVRPEMFDSIQNFIDMATYIYAKGNTHTPTIIHTATDMSDDCKKILHAGLPKNRE